MPRSLSCLPLWTTLAVCFLLILHGPIAQLPHYHQFADQNAFLGVPHAMNVLSNMGFVFAGCWGVHAWRRARPTDQPIRMTPGYAMFLIGLLLTACGSTYYHLAPDDARLVWDRLPIALTCAGLLAALRGEREKANERRDAVVLAVAAGMSIVWWVGTGDLRPYLVMQFLPMLLLPLWSFLYPTTRRDKYLFAAALMAYAMAKIAELNDAVILQTMTVSGHTLKHLLAALAAQLLVIRFSSQRIHKR